ncbi:unnamed protein product [Rotaria sordida]|uniref:Uncharacterized protein n=1 Tax=Rotaria sordida TaxID=392033 RepID=A0A813UP00_9BILA|nr:unnamed protein product [Rotaria sordida]CAF0826095.1 unnamed protein product [Rotaria sordida]
MLKRRKAKGQGNKDQLLSEQSSIPPANKTSKIPINNSTTTNGKQGSSIQQIISNPIKPITKPFYYDNLDDIPFIDESRPTSVVDIAQV